MTRLAVAAGVFIVALAVYTMTLAPDVGMTDSGELTVAAHFLGVAHPPGFPVWTMVTHLFTKIPIGSVAVRANFASAFFAALAAAAMTFVATDLVIAACAGLALAFSRTMWSYATVAEVYALNAFLCVVMIACAIAWRRTRDVRYVRAAAIAFGLALGVHYVTAGIVGIGVAILIGRVRLRDVAPFVLAGLLSYAYLPIAASRNPPMNWGNPTTLSRFVDHVTAKQYRSYVSEGEFTRPTKIAAREFPLILIAGVIALVLCRDRRLQIALAAIIVIDFAWVLVYPIANDLDAYLLPMFIALIVAASTLTIRSAAIVVVIVTAIMSYNDRYARTYARMYVLDTLANVPLNATLVTGDWQLISPMLYLQSVEHVRPDVHLVQSGLLIRSWYLQPGKLREAIEAWEHGAPPTAAISELNRYFTELARSQRVFVTAEVTATRQLAPAMQELAKTHDFVPHGFAIEIAPGHQPRAVSKFTPRATPPPELAIRYREAFKRQARALMRAKRFDDAIAQYERALQIDPDDGETRYELGIARAQPALTAP